MKKKIMRLDLVISRILLLKQNKNIGFLNSQCLLILYILLCDFRYIYIQIVVLYW